MATRSTVAVLCSDELIRKIYVHFDGYHEGVGAELLANYNNQEKAEALVALGDCSSIIEEVITYKSRGEDDCDAQIVEHPSQGGNESYNYYWDGDSWTENSDPEWNKC